MNFVKNLFNFYINASIHLGLMAYAFVRITELYFQLPYNEPLDYVIFYGTIFGYNFVKYVEVSKLHHKNLTKSLKSIQVFSVISLGATVYYILQLSLKTQLFFVPFSLLTVLYAIPFLSGFQRNLRNIAFIKNMIIALVWAGVTVLIPVFDVQNQIDSISLLMCMQRFLIILILLIPFDIRDMRYDNDLLKTIPQIIGVFKAKKVGFVLLLITLFLEFRIAPNVYFKNVFLGMFFVILFLLMKTKEHQNKYYSSFWIDAVPTFWWLLLLMIVR